MSGKFTKYDVPGSMHELFQNQEANYSIIDYNKEMDNIQSMEHFLDVVGVHGDCVIEDSGTQVELRHGDYTYALIIDSGGLGDFFSHGFCVTTYAL